MKFLVSILVSAFISLQAAGMDSSSFEFTPTVQPSERYGLTNAGVSQLKLVCNPQQKCSINALKRSHCARVGCCWTSTQKCVANKLIFVKFCPGGNCGCGPDNNFRINLLFALDASWSVSDANFIKEKEFVKSIVDKLEIERFSVGVFQYSTNVRNDIPIAKGRTKDEIKALIDNVERNGGNTDSHLAIIQAFSIFQLMEYDLNNDRNVFIFTNDGPATYPQWIQYYVALMDKYAKVPTTRYAVGVSGSLQAELNQIASSPDKAIYGPTFDDFATFVDSIATSLNAVGCGDS